MSRDLCFTKKTCQGSAASSPSSLSASLLHAPCLLQLLPVSCVLGGVLHGQDGEANNRANRDALATSHRATAYMSTPLG